MTWSRQYELRDPAVVCERIEEEEQRRYARSRQGKTEKAKIGIEQLFARESMTQDESEQIERLLVVWYDYENAYRPPLGAPRMSVSCRDHEAGEVHDTGADRDDKLERLTAEAVGSAIDELPYLQRAAIGVHCRNARAAAQVHRNPRIADQHAAYHDAKAALAPLLRRKGLLAPGAIRL